MNHVRGVRWLTTGLGTAVALGGGIAFAISPAAAASSGVLPAASPSASVSPSTPACVVTPDRQFKATGAHGAVHPGFSIANGMVTFHAVTDGCTATVTLNDNYKTGPGGGHHQDSATADITGHGTVSLPVPSGRTDTDCFDLVQFDVVYAGTHTMIGNIVLPTTSAPCTTPTPTSPTPTTTPPTTPTTTTTPPTVQTTAPPVVIGTSTQTSPPVTPTPSASTTTPATQVLGEHTTRPPSGGASTSATSTAVPVAVLGEKIVHPAAPGGAATDVGTSSSHDGALAAIFGGLAMAFGGAAWGAAKRRA